MNCNFNNFITFMELKENSDDNIKDSIRTIKHFFTLFDKFTKNNMLNYKQNFLINSKLYKPGTINKKIGHVNKFAKFNNIDYHLKIIPNDSFKELISIRDYQRFLKFALKYDYYELYLLVRTLFETGIRLKSLKDITFDSVIKKSFITKVKGSPVNQPLLKDLSTKLKIYCIKNNIKGIIFDIDKNKNKMYRDMSCVAGKARLKKSKFKPHALRSLSIRFLIENKHHPKYVQEFSGHRNINSLDPYIKNRTIAEKRNQLKILEDISKDID